MIFDISFSPERIGNVPDLMGTIIKEAERVSRRRSGENYFRIAKSFIDARHKDNIKIVYRIEVVSREEYIDLETFNSNTALPLLGKKVKNPGDRPIIVGFGPAGMYAGLVLAKYGLRPIIIERGQAVEQRAADVDKYRTSGQICENSNIQFGEGGAGTFSDGKLYTGVSSGLKGFISDIMISHGAPADIAYDSHPHVGTDNLINVIRGIREEIIALGGEILFDTCLTDIVTDTVNERRVRSILTNKGSIECNKLILAIGNSSRDTVKMLASHEIAMEPKAFSVGVRIEHRREMIDKAQYGFDTALYKNIFAANYKLAVDTCTGRKLYTFCMCPGGEVIAAASSSDSICTNGMSYRARDGRNSNSALLVPVTPADFGEGVLDGIQFQEKLEHNAFVAGGSDYCAPISTYGAFCGNPDMREKQAATESVVPTYIPGTREADLRDVLPPFVFDTLKDGIKHMGRRIRGFDNPDSILTAVEARSSSPVRILRDRDTYESLNTNGLYLSGEGAGYAGGIMSSAIDGIKCANRLAESMLQ